MTPGQRERAEAELGAAAEAHRAASTLLDAGLPRDAASRLYYAVFHAARAALMSRGRSVKTHAGQRVVFEYTFGAAPVLARLLELRIDADYRADEFGAEEPALRALVEEAASFLDRCAQIVADEVSAGVDDPDPRPDL